MKTFIFVAALLFSFSATATPTATTEQKIAGFHTPAIEEHLLDNKIYFFVHPMCTNCKTAFIYFEQNHKNAGVQMTNMSFKHNLDLYKECVKKFNIKNQELRLPLICMGDNAIMGWEPEKARQNEQMFEQYLKQFQAKNQQ